MDRRWRAIDRADAGQDRIEQTGGNATGRNAKLQAPDLGRDARLLVSKGLWEVP